MIPRVFNLPGSICKLARKGYDVFFSLREAIDGDVF
jgi:hypothetical protein